MRMQKSQRMQVILFSVREIGQTLEEFQVLYQPNKTWNRD